MMLFAVDDAVLVLLHIRHKTPTIDDSNVTIGQI